MSLIRGSPGGVSSLDNNTLCLILRLTCSFVANPLLVPSPWSSPRVSREATGDLSSARSVFNPEAISALLSGAHIGRQNSPECEEHSPFVIPHESSALDLPS